MQESKFYYKVVIGDGKINGENHLEFRLDEQQFNVINLSVFIDLGFVVVIHKIYDNV